MSRSLLLHFISGCFLMIPRDEQGASRSILSKQPFFERIFQGVPLHKTGRAPDGAEAFSRPGPWRRCARTGHSSLIWSVFVPCPAHASRTRSPAAPARPRGRPSASLVLDVERGSFKRLAVKERADPVDGERPFEEPAFPGLHAEFRKPRYQPLRPVIFRVSILRVNSRALVQEAEEVLPSLRRRTCRTISGRARGESCATIDRRETGSAASAARLFP